MIGGYAPLASPLGLGFVYDEEDDLANPPNLKGSSDESGAQQLPPRTVSSYGWRRIRRRVDAIFAIAWDGRFRRQSK